MSLSIRQALAEDIHHLTGIDAVARNDERRLEQLAQAIRARECWIACEANDAATPLGYGCLDRSFFGEYFIPLVVVSDASRRTGVGRQLMTHLERVASAQKVFTSTNTSNLPMRQLLAQLGYQHSGTIENLDPGDPELVFVKFMG